MLRVPPCQEFRQVDEVLDVGLVQVDELAAREIFDKFDSDDSGAIGTTELRAMLKMLGLHPSQEELEKSIRDVGHDLEVSFDEFWGAVQKSNAGEGAKPFEMGPKEFKQLQKMLDDHPQNDKVLQVSANRTVVGVTLAAALLPLLWIVAASYSEQLADMAFKNATRSAMAGVGEVEVTMAIVELLALPLFLLCMMCVLGSAQHMVGDAVEGVDSKHLSSNMVLICLAIVTVGQLSSIAELLLQAHQAEMLRHYLWVGLGVLAVQGWFFLVDSFEGILIKMADIQDWSAAHSVPRMKQTNIMMGFTHFHEEAKDRVYSFSEHKPSSRAVADLLCVYTLLAKIYAAIAFVCVYLKVEAGMYFYVLLVLTSAIITKHLSPAIDNLLRISQSKPFYLGDLVAVSHFRCCSSVRS